jgi:hypothetical protein
MATSPANLERLLPAGLLSPSRFEEMASTVRPYTP